MDRSKFDAVQKLYHKIQACDNLLRVPKQNSIYAEVNSLYTTRVVIPIDLWDKIMEAVKIARQQYNEELNAL